MSNSLYVVAKIRISKEYRDEFLAMAKELVAASSSEEGNIFYTLNESVNDPESFFFIEHWMSQQAIDEHNKTAHFAALINAIKEKALPITIDLAKPVY